MISSQDGTEERLLRAVLRLGRPACSATGAAAGAGTADVGCTADPGCTADGAAPFSASAGPGGESSRAASALAIGGAWTGSGGAGGAGSGMAGRTGPGRSCLAHPLPGPCP